ncbi:MAG TPA: hypothetical protein VNI58_07530 [Mariprofundaceae bacterium]|nr:hypothetical protein [Mariprofundaceae bacterium]
MKRLLAIATLLLGAAWAGSAVAADSCSLSYKLKPGQVWLATVSNQFKATESGDDSTQASGYSVRYRVLKGEKPGWVKLEAKIVAHSAQGQGGIDYTKLTYTADMHTSGELRRIAHSGSAMPPMPEDQLAQMPPQYAAMMQQSAEMLAKAMQPGVFWFPELPEEKLSVGDSFEVVQKSDLGGGTGMQMQTVVKSEFTLEDISEGLAYFSVRQRAQSKAGGMGGSSETRTAGKADAIFDLEQGMWVEMTAKSQSTSSFSGSGGMSGEMGGMQLIRYRMQLQ